MEQRPLNYSKGQPSFRLICIGVVVLRDLRTNDKLLESCEDVVDGLVVVLWAVAPIVT